MGEKDTRYAMNVHCASDWECTFGWVALFHRIRFPFSACVPFNGILMHLCLWSFRAASTARHALPLFPSLGDDCSHFRHIPNSCNNTTMSLVKDGVATPELMYGRNFKEIAARTPDSCDCVPVDFLAFKCTVCCCVPLEQTNIIVGYRPK